MRKIGMMPIRVGCRVEFIKTYANGGQALFRGTVISSGVYRGRTQVCCPAHFRSRVENPVIRKETLFQS